MIKISSDFGQELKISGYFWSSFILFQVLCECFQDFVSISLKAVEEIMIKNEIPCKMFDLYLATLQY